MMVIGNVAVYAAEFLQWWMVLWGTDIGGLVTRSLNFHPYGLTSLSPASTTALPNFHVYTLVRDQYQPAQLGSMVCRGNGRVGSRAVNDISKSRVWTLLLGEPVARIV